MSSEWKFSDRISAKSLKKKLTLGIGGNSSDEMKVPSNQINLNVFGQALDSRSFC
jgi:hypothetical protein